jgi:two-component system response regulator GlrR
MARSPRRRVDSEAARAPAPSPSVIDLVLYVSPSSRYTLIAERNCRQVLARLDPKHVRFEICDVRAHPERAEEDAVCYTPMLVKRHPLPRTYVLGDLSNTEPLVGMLESCGVSFTRQS